MTTTSISLLWKLKQPNQEVAWGRFVDLYAPLIFHWGIQQGLTSTDAADLVQEVLMVLVVKLPDFEHDPNQRFRGWLRTITVNKAKNFHRRKKVRREYESGQQATQQVSSDDPAGLFEEAQYRKYLIGRVKKLIEVEFEPVTWKACWKHVTEDRTAAEVGQELGISANAVRVAKSRVLRRLREELAGLLD
ncbi:MAG: RNA polymerase subunit sigma [Blastopirellula sp.]|nr:MAG: RNA polymerase subunit sigma [Blastopirellula sp.]